MGEFKVVSEYKPSGDQPRAIDELSKDIAEGNQYQTLLGVTGSGKTFTMANIIQKVKKPTLIISHNKTLAAQLCGEFKEFFPENAVEFFVSYYDYYQPEAYVHATDTYIEKDSEINEEIEKLRHSATAALFERKDVVIVASVSCIYGLGNPIDYENQVLSLRTGKEMSREKIVRKLVDIQYMRNDINFIRSTFRVRGDTIDIFPSGGDSAIRVELFGDEIESIKEINVLTGEILGLRDHISIFPASHYATTKESIDRAVVDIEEELEERIKYYNDNGMLLEAQRIEQRTRYDIEMLKEIGTCKGIENYSRHLNNLPERSRPYTLIDYFPDDFLIIIDESHAMLPQLRGMYAGDQARKKNLVEYGFRLPSALDNRPLNFDEFKNLAKQVLFVSATPAEFERTASEGHIAEQIVRPTGLLDPIIEVRKSEGQIDDLIGEINKVVAKKERVLVTTLTKKMSEALTDYLRETGIKVRYMHSEIDTLERMEILRDLRLGEFDVLVGINLLREGLDLPEVSLVAILDADKEGFLRNETSLVQTTGRAARNVNGKVIMYADKMTKSMRVAIDENDRRRAKQEKYNQLHNIEPKTIQKEVRAVIEATKTAEETDKYYVDSNEVSYEEIKNIIIKLEEEMLEAATNLQFERAAGIRDKIIELKEKVKEGEL